jgi:hypothetical protein
LAYDDYSEIIERAEPEAFEDVFELRADDMIRG